MMREPMGAGTVSTDAFPAPSGSGPNDDHDELRKLGERIAELAARINSAEARMMTLIAEFDRRGGWKDDGYSSCAEWLAWRTGTKIGTARERVRTARALERLSRTANALREGSISYAKVRALTRVATPEREAELFVTLAEARAKALENRRAIQKGMDPRTGGMPTFERAAEKVIALHAKNWKGDASEKQWRQCLRDYVFPKLGRKRVGEITTADVLACLAPIWNEKRPTAARVRQRIGAVMKWAVARGYREDNPAGDAIAAALPRGTRHRTHFRALPHGEVEAALGAVRESDAWLGIRLCLEFVALTATRSGEARRARWPEIDRDRATWTVPAERMKTGREHRVPLSTGALAVLEEAREIENGSGLIFPSFKGRELRSPQVAGAFRDLGIPSTVHGLRSSFRDWAAETGVDRTVAEAALAHKVGRVEGAYFRSDLFERRREVMQDWSAYLAAGRAGAGS